MANLKFKDIEWEKGLMYVEFENGQRWYPKWKDLATLMDSSWATEHGLNNKKWMSFLTFINLTLLTRMHLLDSKVDHDKIIAFNRLADSVKTDFIERL